MPLEVPSVPGLDYNLYSWFVEVGIDFIFAAFSGDWTLFLSQVLLGPFEIFFGDVFKGRPKVGKDSASDNTALFFLASPNPVIALWGVGIRGLEASGVPTSVSGGVGLTHSIQLAEHVLANLKTQFDGPTTPKQVLHNAYGTYPVTGLNMYTWYHQLGFNTNNPDSNSAALQERRIIDGFYLNLIHDGYLDPTTGFPKVPAKVKPPPPPPPNPPGHIPAPPSAPPPNADEQEICCWYEEQYAYALAAAAANVEALLRQQVGNDQCCNEVVAALTEIFHGLAAATAAIAAGTAGIAHAINLEPLTAGLTHLVAELHAEYTAAAPGRGELLKAVDRIAAAAEKEKPVDLKPISDALVEANKLQDVPHEIIQLLVSEGFMTSEMAQAVGGSAHVKVAAGAYKFSPIAWIHALNKWLGSGPAPSLPSATSFAKTIHDSSEALFDATFKASGKIFGPIVSGILDAHRGEIGKLHNVNPCGEEGVATSLLTEAIGASIAAHFAAVAVETIYPTKNLGFEKVADVIAAFTGIEDLIGGLIGVEVQQLIATPHRYCVNAQGRPILPGTGPAAELHARGLISAAQAAQLLAWNGINREYETPTLNAAFAGLNPRMMLRLIETGLFTDHDIADELTFAGMRPASQHRMLLAAPYLATEPERKQLRATYEKAYVEGFMSDTELTDQIDAAEHNTSRSFLILDRVRLEKRMALAKDLEAQQTELYIGNLINDATYHANLAGLGLEPDRVRALSARNEARAAVTLARQEAAAARALAKATALEERRAALRNYLNGHIDGAALAAALELTGLTHAQTAAWVDMAVLQKEGMPRFAFGLRLAPDQAQLLTDRVRALNDQRKRQLVSDAAYANALKALKLPPLYINALRAAADATITPAKSAQLLVVETGG